MDYYIDTPEDLTNILGACIRKNTTRGSRFIIRRDLDCGKITNFAPLGNGSRYSFDGELDGADHVIKNLEICPRQTYDLGFFAKIGAGTVKNLRFEAACVRQDISGMRSGANTTRAGIIAAVCQGTILNCSAQGTMTVQEGTGACLAGGLCGSLSYAESEIRRSWADVSISFQAGGTENGKKKDDALCLAGGIAGSANGIIEACHSAGSVAGPPDASKSYAAGGICGKADSCAKITSCYNLGYLYSRAVEGDALGGIAGITEKEAVVSACFYLSWCLRPKSAGERVRAANQAGDKKRWEEFTDPEKKPGSVLSELGSGYACTPPGPDGYVYAPHLVSLEKTGDAGALSEACLKALCTPAALSFAESVYPHTTNPVKVDCALSDGALAQVSLTAVRPDQTQITVEPPISGSSFSYNLGNNEYINYDFLLTLKDKYGRTVTISDTDIETTI